MRFLSGRLWGPLPSVDTGITSMSVNEERGETRLTIALREYPRTLTWAACVLLVMTVVTFFSEQTHENPGHSNVMHINDLLVAGVLFGSAFVLKTDVIPRKHRPSFFAVPAVLLVWSLLWQVTVEGTSLNYTYAMFVLIGFGATSLAAGPYICGAALSVCAASLVAIYGPVDQAGDWILVAFTAAGIGAILLRIRLQSIIALADATALAKRLATHDQLTGVLNRHGLIEHVPEHWATAERCNESVFVAFIDIRGLKQANDRFGHDYGDSLILSAAQTAMKSMRGSELLARWGGDEFLVVGIGDLDDAERLARRVESSAGREVVSSQIGGLSIGVAAGLPGRSSLTDLTTRADEDMYLRRTTESAVSD